MQSFRFNQSGVFGLEIGVPFSAQKDAFLSLAAAGFTPDDRAPGEVSVDGDRSSQIVMKAPDGSGPMQMALLIETDDLGVLVGLGISIALVCEESAFHDAGASLKEILLNEFGAPKISSFSEESDEMEFRFFWFGDTAEGSIVRTGNKFNEELLRLKQEIVTGPPKLAAWGRIQPAFDGVGAIVQLAMLPDGHDSEEKKMVLERRMAIISEFCR